MNNDLFADDSPMIEGSVEPAHQQAQNNSNIDMFGEPVPVQQNVVESSFEPQGNAGFDDLGGPAVAEQTESIQIAAKPSSPVVDDEFFTSAPAVSSPVAAHPIPAPSPVAAASATAAVSSTAPNAASPMGSQRNLAASATSLPVASPDQAFLERGQAKLESQRRAVQERTMAMDAATKNKEQEIQKKAAEYLQEVAKKREIMIATVKADHIREQQQYEAKMSQFKKSGAVWNSVNLLVETKKPNTYSKNTEYMRKLIVELQQA